MAVTYGFYNALNHDRVYDALQMSSIFDGIIQNGVFSTIGEALICKASGTGLIVNVGSGRAWFDHTWTLNDTDYPVEAEQAEVVLDRIDAIVLEVNQAVEVRANSIKFVKGTPSSTPVRPTMIHNAEVNQYALAYVNVRAGQTTIFDSDITNVVGTAETPFVTGLLQQLSVEQLLLQWNDDFYRYFNNFKTVSTADFNSFMTTKQTEYAAWYANMQAEGAADLAEFDAWFQHMKDQLDEDAAGHLQAEIDALALQAEKGSIIRVTTPESTLINQTCTITQDLLSRTATFDSHGVADFPSVPMIGDMVITSTDGTMTAIRNINIPYFGRYEFEIAFWSATLAIHTTSSDLYGRPITIKQGTTTIGTTTFNQQGVASFDVHSAGTYTVSAVTTGGTESTADVVVTEQTTYNVELGSTPEGATVTPTDVISTWIACAGLENSHNYTTLAEVMADTELFDTLLRDSNACDYMARSTTWAKAEGLVPTMTSDTTPSGECVANNSRNDRPPYYAFDRNNSTMHTTDNNVAKANYYLGYQFPTAKRVSKVEILADSYNSSYYYDVAVYGGNALNELTKISDDIRIQANSGSGTKISAPVNATTNYDYYVIKIVNSNGDYSNADNYGLFVYSIQFFEADITSDRDAMTRVGLYDYCSEKLLSNATWAEAIANSEYFEYVLNTKVPVMTSNTTPSGTVSASNVYSSDYPWKAFDNNTSTYWRPVVNTSAGATYYLQYAFPESVNIKSWKIQTGVAHYRWSTIKLKASNDGTNFQEIDSITSSGASSGALDAYRTLPNNNEKYSYYRMEITATGTDPITIPELQFYGHHSSEQLTTQIHSCPNDTIYHMANGSPVVLATTDADGVGEVDWGELPAGDLTLYSSVAKDPDNLSNDYHKVCTITKTAYGHTTDFYLMPDPVKTLYWWGYNPYEHVYASSSVSVTLTFNTNDFRLSSYNTNYEGNVTFNKSVNDDSLKLVYKMPHEYSELNKQVLGTRTTYTANTSSQLDSYTRIIRSDSQTLLTHDATSDQGEYPSIKIGQGTDLTCYALWYE